MFFGRQQELLSLRREYTQSRPSLIVLYGRRRVGKSTLLLESVRRKAGAVYFQANRLTLADNLSLFKSVLQGVLPPDRVLEGLSDWSSVLLYLARGSGRAGRVVILDEFPYLCETDPSLPSQLQATWDTIVREGHRFKLVLCGSLVAFMEALLAEKNPLFGRQTLKLRLEPLDYRDAALRFDRWTPEQRLTAYGTLGGMPYYLALADPGKPLAEVLKRVALTRGSPLFSEGSTLLQAELSSVARYASVLRAVADGCTQWGQIVSRVPEFPSGSALAPYLQKLIELGLVETVRSLDANDKTRHRHYYLSDPFLTFWFRFVLPFQSALEAGHHEAVWNTQIAPQLSDHMGGMFERICRDFMRLHLPSHLGLPALEVGRIFGADYDLDVVAELLDGRVVFGECKWWTAKVGVNILEKLKVNSFKTSFGKNASERVLALFSRSGFTPELEALALTRPDVWLFTPQDLLEREEKR